MKKLALIAVLAATTALTSAAQAATLYTSLDDWKAAAGSYTRDTAYGGDFTNIAGVSLDGGATVSLNGLVNIRTIGSGWSTWSGGYTGQVLYSIGASTVDALITPVSGFGFFVEPEPFSVHNFTLTLSDGSSIGAAYNGQSGAGFLGWIGPGITGFSIDSDTDFAFGDFYTAGAAVPEPATWAMLIVGFGLTGAMLRRRRLVAQPVSYI